ncbi:MULTISPECIES: Fic family protein [unclassified Beijerinckia]|uniref:Fic family protein n=1 Tax=unclassified Beijerinckia TaxID=2638183 RepID=UPI0008990170|nr:MULTISPECIES: Fic family protein [unclassified Beijerinckia]MDH7794992.1 fido (protein-threonine AMPylation protein) [Beijerinckia sp. GAS462]SEB83240.1 Fic/DOC family protein [Beijerinckia sp. 28-YEA-48]
MSFPSWQAHQANDYDAKMSKRCDQLLHEIKSDQSRRQSIIGDPRHLHAELLADFAPAGYSEYAGTYRGTPATTLAKRAASSPSQLAPGTTYNFLDASLVRPAMDKVLNQASTTISSRQSIDDATKLWRLACTFCWLGKIHPFLDGTGHIQRAFFAAMAYELGIPVTNRFSIHPRPFGKLLAIALELFTRAPQGQENDQVDLIAEYLAFFLGGPFDAPGKNLPP